MSQAGLIEIDTTIPSDVPIIFQGNSGSGSAIANIFEILGTGGVSTSVASNVMTITVSAEGMTWNLISSSQTLSPNNGYFCVSPGGILSLRLPPVSNLGDVIEICLDGSAGFTITQGAGQTIRLGNVSTTAGIGGSLTSTQQGDVLRLVCQVANLKWNVLSCEGNLTIA